MLTRMHRKRDARPQIAPLPCHFTIVRRIMYISKLHVCGVRLRTVRFAADFVNGK